MIKEKIEKDQERYINMDKIMAQLDILVKNDMGRLKSVNVVGIKPRKAQLYNEDVNFLANEGG